MHLIKIKVTISKCDPILYEISKQVKSIEKIIHQQLISINYNKAKTNIDLYIELHI